MAFMKDTSLQLALYESAYATEPKIAEEAPQDDCIIPLDLVKAVRKDNFAGDGTRTASDHIRMIEDISG